MTDSPRVAGIVLASGMSTRFGGRNKLLVPMGGTTLIQRTVHVFLKSSLDPVLVVLGHDARALRRVLEGMPVTMVHNPDYREGQSRALVRGVQAVPTAIQAAVIGVADQPLLSTDLIAAMLWTFRETRAPIIAPRYNGQPGNPVLYERVMFPELLEVQGDRGGRHVVMRHAGHVAWIDLGDATLGGDIDTDSDYRRFHPV